MSDILDNFEKMEAIQPPDALIIKVYPSIILDVFGRVFWFLGARFITTD